MHPITLTTPAHTLHLALHQTTLAVAHGTHRPELTEILAHAENATLHLIASNGSRLHHTAIPLAHPTPKPLDFTIPTAAVHDHTRQHWAHTHAPAEITVDTTSLIFQLGTEPATRYTHTPSTGDTVRTAFTVVQESRRLRANNPPAPITGFIDAATFSDVITAQTQAHATGQLQIYPVITTTGQTRLLMAFQQPTFTPDTDFLAIALPATAPHAAAA